MSVKRLFTHKLLLSGFALLALVLQPFAGVAHAATVQSYTAMPFVASEWVTDRAAPSGGINTVDFAGRTGVAELKIDKDLQSTMGSFYHTEGIQRQITASDSIKADLYVDGDWFTNSKTVRAGLWGVGRNAANAIAAYPILEFTTDGFTGWRVWDSTFPGGWVNLTTPFSTDTWNTIEVVHNDATGMFDFKLNGTTVSSLNDIDTTSFSAIILNSKNYGSTAQSYDVHWSNLATGVATVEPEVTAQTFGTVDDTNYGFKGISTDFGMFDFTEVSSITVTLTNADGTTVTNTANSTLISMINANPAAWTGFTSPFVVTGTFADDYCNNGPCWTTSAHTWTKAGKPVSATAIVVGKNATGDEFTKSATNTNFTESTLPFDGFAPDAPVTNPGQGSTNTPVALTSSTSTTTPSEDEFADDFADAETLGAATDTDTSDDSNKSDEKADDKSDDKTETKNQNGLAWYWWILIILAAAGAGYWLYNAMRRNNTN